jgi:hypothetical protein
MPVAARVLQRLIGGALLAKAEAISSRSFQRKSRGRRRRSSASWRSRVRHRTRVWRLHRHGFGLALDLLHQSSEWNGRHFHGLELPAAGRGRSALESQSGLEGRASRLGHLQSHPSARGIHRDCAADDPPRPKAGVSFGRARGKGSRGQSDGSRSPRPDGARVAGKILLSLPLILLLGCPKKGAAVDVGH